MAKKPDKDKRAAAAERKDAEGQFVRTRHGERNDGVDSAEPRVITGSEDATFDTDPRDDAPDSKKG